MIDLGAKIRAAHARGTLDRLDISPELMVKKKAFDQLQADMPRHPEKFFEHISQTLSGKRVFTYATWNLLHNMAKAGLARGLEGVFAADSCISTSGGAKGMVQPVGWVEDILRFTGASQLHESYAMSEVLGAHRRCEHGHYHLAPTVIPYQLDPETSRPLPRSGRVTGRAAFYDLSTETRWGGFISGDEITIELDSTLSAVVTVGAYRVIGGKDGEGSVIVSQIPEPVPFATALDDRTANLVPIDTLEEVRQS